jgi:Kef-type K+ transport system membrane component KefB
LEIVAYYIIGKQKELQLLLLISIIILAIVIAKFLNLFSILVLLIVGIAARNYDNRHALMEIDFGWLSHLLFIPFFFITGCYLDFTGFIESPLIVLTFIVLRLACQTTSVFLFKNLSVLTRNQAIALALSLTPLTGLAIDITSKVLNYSPEIGHSLLVIVSAAIALLGILGPIITQAVFRKTGESFETFRNV